MVIINYKITLSFFLLTSKLLILFCIFSYYVTGFLLIGKKKKQKQQQQNTETETDEEDEGALPFYWKHEMNLKLISHESKLHNLHALSGHKRKEKILDTGA